MSFLTKIRQVFSKLITKSTIETALHIKTAISTPMASAIDLWSDMYKGNAPWIGDKVQSLGIPSAIASEIARLTTIEMQSEVSGSERADFLNTQYQRVILELRTQVEYGAAKGGMIFKPYIDGADIVVDFVPADRFYPIAFDTKGRMTSVVFVERLVKGKAYYTRLEIHERRGNNYFIKNKFYRSTVKSIIGNEISAKTVPEWSSLETELQIQNIKGMLFGFYKPALANTVDPESPLGVSVYARAVDLIKEADEQYSRLLWEYEGGELAIDASVDLFMKKGDRLQLPKGKERLFRTMDLDTNDGATGLNAWVPQLRDESFVNGLNELLCRIEDTCGLARGTFSDLQSEAKTATEIKVLRQRSYATIADNQKALQAALEQLIYAMDVWITLGSMAPAGKYEISFEWDDSIIVDTQSEQLIRMQEVSAGLLKPEYYLMWRYGVTEEQAREMLPESAVLLE